MKYKSIANHYESCLEKHGDSNLGVDWPRQSDVDKRHRSMIGVVRNPGSQKTELLDFGCGLSHFWTFLKENGMTNISYTGVDISEKFIAASKAKYPENKYFCVDALKNPELLPSSDYIVANGVFTQKCGLTNEEMWAFFTNTLEILFSKSKVGLAFNVMSKQVDWEKEGSFHVSFDLLAEFLTKKLSRNFIFKHDYGLYEFTTYLYKNEG